MKPAARRKCAAKIPNMMKIASFELRKAGVSTVIKTTPDRKVAVTTSNHWRIET